MTFCRQLLLKGFLTLSCKHKFGATIAYINMTGMCLDCGKLLIDYFNVLS